MHFTAGTRIERGELVRIGKDGKVYPMRRRFPLPNGDILYIFNGDYEIRDFKGDIIDRGYVEG